MEWAALAAAIGGPVVGVAGVIFGWLNSKGEREKTIELAGRQREHERLLAREERLHDELRASYEELLRLLFLIQMVITRTHPDGDQMPDPPENPADEEVRRIKARASVVGSEEVITEVEHALDASAAFMEQARRFDNLRSQYGRVEDGQFREYFRYQRRRFDELLRNAQSLIREDVRD
jgi:hypothetical protein